VVDGQERGAFVRVWAASTILELWTFSGFPTELEFRFCFVLIALDPWSLITTLGLTSAVNCEMKTALTLLALGLFLALVAPFFWADYISSVSVTLPQFAWSKSPSRTLEFSGTTLFRMVGVFFVALALLWFIFSRSGGEKETHPTDAPQD